MTKIDLIIIRYAIDIYKGVYNFFNATIFGFKLNLIAVVLFIVQFAIFELEHNKKVQMQLTLMAEKGYLKYFGIVAIAFIIFIIAI